MNQLRIARQRILVRFSRVTIIGFAIIACAASSPRASWKITTYLHPVGNPPVTSMRLADQYFTGAKPQRFTGAGSATMLDFYEGGSPGRFDVNNTFPGLDNPPGTFPDNFTARVTGALRVDVAGAYDFTAFNTFGTRFRLDLNRDGTIENDETILPRVTSTEPPNYLARSNLLALEAGNYGFELSYFRSTGFSNLEVAYRIDGLGQDFLLGDIGGGVGLTDSATVNTVGAAVTDPGFTPIVMNFALADALRTGPNESGFPVTESREVFNMLDTLGSGSSRLSGKQGAPGLGPVNFDDDSNFLVVGTGKLVVPPGGISNAQFRSTTDDGGRLLIDTNQDGDLDDPVDVIIFDDRLHATEDVFSRRLSLSEGSYLMEYSFFEMGGGAEGAVSVNLGGGFTLLGDDAAVAAGTGLDVVPEPSSVVLASLASLGVACLSHQRRSLSHRVSGVVGT